MIKVLKKMLLLNLILVSTVFCNQYYSQCKQDQFANEHFFKNKRHGVFVDIGAYDGMLISNSYFFELNLGWRGICVEPMPEIYERLKKNRICHCIKGCIADYEDSVPFLQLNGLDMYSGIIDKFDPKHLSRISQEMEYYHDSSKIIYVDTFIINNLLEKYEYYHVDFLSIDTEGGELDILQSIDFDRFDIDVITVENNYNDPKFKDFLESKGYEYVTRLECDEMYKKKY